MPGEVATEAKAYVLGGNASTLAFVSSFAPEHRQIFASLVPLAWTPAGVTLGDSWQRVGIAADNVAAWVDQTFSPDDERAFVSSPRDMEMLTRVGWSSAAPAALSEDMLLNPEDVPEDVLEALHRPVEALTQCAICRRTCVRDHFVWGERRLCAWDYHAVVFGKRGPWRNEPYEDRLFETLPAAMYVAEAILGELNVEVTLAMSGLSEASSRKLVNLAIAEHPGPAFMAVRTGGGLTLLRERAAESPEPPS